MSQLAVQRAGLLRVAAMVLNGHAVEDHEDEFPTLQVLIQHGRRLLEESDEEEEMEETSSSATSAILSNVFLFLLVGGLSATVNLKSLKEQLSNKFAIGCGVAMQFVIMPLLGCKY